MSSRRSSHFWWPVGLTLLLAAIPYLWGWFLAVDRHYVWINHNLDDNMVYLAWMRQAADGAFFLTNRWTAESHPSMYTNLLFWLMGRLSGITHIPLIGMFHFTRIALSVALMGTVWLATAHWMGVKYQRLTMWLVGLSAGLGWLFTDDRPKVMLAPIDAWQPEAITFLSIYLNPLFVTGLLLILATNLLLWLSLHRQQARWAVYAGLCALLLGNIHSYDVIPLTVTWLLYGLCLLIWHRDQIKRYLLYGMITAVIALPSVIWQYAVYKLDPVFHERAGSYTPAPEIWWVLLGFGFLIPLALIGLYRQHRAERLSSSHLLLACWSVAALGTQYIPKLLKYIGVDAPLNFERKMVMGAHIPLAILAAMGVVYLIQKQHSLSQKVAIPVLLLLLSLSNMVWIYHDCRLLWYNIANTGLHQPYIDAKRWSSFIGLRQYIKPDDVVLCPVSMGVFLPVEFGARTYAGHWSETPYFADKMHDIISFYNPGTTDDRRNAFLNGSQIKWVISFHGKQTLEEMSLQHPFDRLPAVNGNSMSVKYSDTELTLFEVDDEGKSNR
ncbi:MAG: hypothetical protein ACYC1M_04885 [Armatimonadota bacterium]